MRWIVATLAAMLAAPLATAHAPLAGAEYEALVWQDGTFEQNYVQDGYDLHDLWMWEAYDPVLGEGMMLRFHIYGGNTTGVYDTFWIHAALEVDNETHTFSWWSHDDVNWQGDLPITLLASNHTPGPASLIPGVPDLPAGPDVPDAPLPDLGGGWAHEMLVFVPLSEINATVGDTVKGWQWRTTAERDRLTQGRTEADVDVAPGGFWITGSPRELPEEMPPAPSPDDEPAPPAPGEPISIFLQGPGRHINATGQWADGEVVIRIGNPYNETAQVASVEAPAGATAIGSASKQVGAGKEVLFRFDAPLAAASQTLVWDVVTDIGGHARLELELPAAPVPEPEVTPAPEPPKPLERTDPRATPPPPEQASDPPIIRDKDSPLGVWVVAGALAGVLLVRRKG